MFIVIQKLLRNCCILLAIISICLPAFAEKNYSVLNVHDYQRIFWEARTEIKSLMLHLKPFKQQTTNEQIAFIAKLLADKPYGGEIGEGDWQPASLTYKPGALHVEQDPVYRLDALDCQTFVEMALTLLHAQTMDQFDQQFLKISYGAKTPNAVEFYNRNHFTDADFNPVNEKNNVLADATSIGELSDYATYTSANLTRHAWFQFLLKNSQDSVRVLHDKDGPTMVHRLEYYSNLYPDTSEKINISYLPKYKLALLQADGSFKPNETLLAKIPTPALVEIVSDPKKWSYSGKNIKDLIGTELNISHLGLLYRKNFHMGELIYHKINCEHHWQQKTCHVTEVYCDQPVCQKLMLAHATEAYPQGYFWYSYNHQFTCSKYLPAKNIPHSFCNRVEIKPLFDYLTDNQYGFYSYMSNPSVLGIHIEKII